MPFAIALAIIALFCFLSVKFRCFACFNLLIIGLAMLIAGLAREESLFITGGALFLGGGLLIMLLTSLKVEKSRRIHYMLNLFLCGMFTFLWLMMLMMIVTIFASGSVRRLMVDYRERVLVDVNGSYVGKVYVDENNVGADGTQYHTRDPF